MKCLWYCQCTDGYNGFRLVLYLAVLIREQLFKITNWIVHTKSLNHRLKPQSYWLGRISRKSSHNNLIIWFLYFTAVKSKRKLTFSGIIINCSVRLGRCVQVAVWWYYLNSCNTWFIPWHRSQFAPIWINYTDKWQSEM